MHPFPYVYGTTGGPRRCLPPWRHVDSLPHLPMHPFPYVYGTTGGSGLIYLATPPRPCYSRLPHPGPATAACLAPPQPPTWSRAATSAGSLSGLATRLGTSAMRWEAVRPSRTHSGEGGEGRASSRARRMLATHALPAGLPRPGKLPSWDSRGGRWRAGKVRPWWGGGQGGAGLAGGGGG